jgi:DNA polymerase III epsilon subunit-like protein
MSRRRLAFLDVETTGLSPLLHELLEFALVYEDGSSVTFKIKPQHPENMSPEAQKVNGYTPEAWVNALEPAEAARRIALAIGDCHIAGQSVKFDIGFLDALARQQDVRIETRYGLDLVTLTYEHLFPLGLRSLSMKNVCDFVGVPRESAIHNALGGASKCRELWMHICRPPWWRVFGWWARSKWSQWRAPVAPG